MSQMTEWYPASVDPVRIGPYEMLNESTGTVFRVFFNGFRWFLDEPLARPLVRVWPWRGLAEKPA